MKDLPLPSRKMISGYLDYAENNRNLQPALLCIAEKMLGQTATYLKGPTLVFGLRGKLFAEMLNQRNLCIKIIVLLGWFLFGLWYLATVQNWPVTRSLFLPCLSAFVLYTVMRRFGFLSTNISCGSNPMYPKLSIKEWDAKQEEELFRKFWLAPQFIDMFKPGAFNDVKTFAELHELTQVRFNELLGKWKNGMGTSYEVEAEREFRTFFCLAGILGIFQIPKGASPMQHFASIYPLLSSKEDYHMVIKNILSPA
ncbi:MAG: hypothetical protein V4686_00870 [Patescibacteria group bacterium]